MPNLSLSFNLRSGSLVPVVAVPPFSPSNIAGLSLWLKADAGVTTRAYSYISNITLSLAGESSINGSYTAETPPTNGSGAYTMTGPNNNRIQVRPTTTPRYRLYNTTSPADSGGNPFYYDFTSNDGVSWSVSSKKPVSITLSNLTGPSATSNGTYSAFEWNTENQSFISPKSVSGGVNNNVVVEVYTNGTTTAYILNPEFFISAEKLTGWGIGSWDLVEGTGSPVGTGTIYPTGGVPTGVVTTTNVVTPNVTVWADQSPLGNNFYGSGNPILNSSDLNTKPTITLSSTEYSEEGDPFLTARWFGSSVNPAIMGDVGTTAFAVIFVDDVCTTQNENGAIFGNFGLAIDGSHYPYGPECSVYDSFATADRKGPLTSPATITNAWSLYSVASTTNDWRAYVNGLLMHSDNSNVYSNAINNSDEDGNGYLQIGYQYQNGNHFLNGKVAEVVIYNRVLTTQERRQVEAYLMDKYAIAPAPPPSGIPVASTNTIIMSGSGPTYIQTFGSGNADGSYIKQSETFYDLDGTRYLYYWSGGNCWVATWSNGDNSYDWASSPQSSASFIPTNWGNGLTITAAGL